jgi:hypothetical protein
LHGLARGPQALVARLRGVKDEGLRARYRPGKWTIAEILCHLRDCDLMFAVRWRRILTEIRPRIVPFDQDRWAAATRYRRQDPRRALSAWAELRAANLEMLRLCGPAGLARGGLHEQYGPFSVEQMARHLLAHDTNHLAQIELALARGRAAKRIRTRLPRS